MTAIALRIHQHRLAQASFDLPQERAERIESLLALRLPRVDVTVDDLVSGSPVRSPAG